MILYEGPDARRVFWFWAIAVAVALAGLALSTLLGWK